LSIVSIWLEALVNYLYSDSFVIPMTKEKFILVSLKDEESKKLAQIITNDTSRKILDYLADKETTESELAEKLGIPISTVHYNLQALVKGRLVEAEEYHYSEKGKEVLHYKLANKYIIIAPKSTFGIKERLKKILPVGLIALTGSFFVYFYNLANGMMRGSFGSVNEQVLARAMPETAKILADDAVIAAVPEVMGKGVEEVVTATASEAATKGVEEVAAVASEAVVDGAGAVADVVGGGAAKIIAEPSLWQSFLQNPASWFLFGCVFTVVLVVIIEFINYKRENRS